MSRLLRYLSSQAGKPSGRLAGILAAPAFNTVNRKMLEEAVAALALKPGESALDVGFGGGSTFALLQRSRPAMLAGAELSMEMIQFALRHTPGLLACCASAQALPYPSACFDAALTANSIYFWPDPLAGLCEIHRVLKPGGRAVVAIRSASCMRRLPLDQQVFRFFQPSELEALVSQAGFTGVTLRHVRPGSPHDHVLVRGEKPNPAIARSV